MIRAYIYVVSLIQFKAVISEQSQLRCRRNSESLSVFFLPLLRVVLVFLLHKGGNRDLRKLCLHSEEAEQSRFHRKVMSRPTICRCQPPALPCPRRRALLLQGCEMQWAGTVETRAACSSQSSHFSSPVCNNHAAV